jgi:hypothetical protein
MSASEDDVGRHFGASELGDEGLLQNRHIKPAQRAAAAVARHANGPVGGCRFRAGEHLVAEVGEPEQTVLIGVVILASLVEEDRCGASGEIVQP